MEMNETGDYPVLGEPEHDILAALGVDRIIFRVEGFADNGEISVADFVLTEGSPLADKGFDGDGFSEFLAQVPALSLDGSASNLIECIHQAVYDALGSDVPGWEQDKGSCGEAILSVPQRSVHVEVEYREVGLDDEEGEEFDQGGPVGGGPAP